MNYFVGVVFLVGGLAMSWYRRGYVRLLREIMVSTSRRDPGDSYMRKMEWMAAGIGVMFAVTGILMLVGVFDAFTEPT